MLTTHINGAPDLVIEILSRGTQRVDRLRKLNLYARHGVQEYWLVTPFPFLIEVLRHREGLFEVAAVYSEAHTLRSFRFPDLQLDLAAIHAALPYTDEMREPLAGYHAY